MNIVANKEGGLWHTGYTITHVNAYGGIKVSGMNTGCGLMQMSGFASFCVFLDEKQLTKVSEVFNNDMKPRLLESGVGSIICTLGDSYYSQSNINKFLELTMFEEVSKYTNYRHGKSATQKLFICKL